MHLRDIPIHVLDTAYAPVPVRAPLRKRKLIMGRMVIDREAELAAHSSKAVRVSPVLRILFPYVPVLPRHVMFLLPLLRLPRLRVLPSLLSRPVRINLWSLCSRKSLARANGLLLIASTSCTGSARLPRGIWPSIPRANLFKSSLTSKKISSWVVESPAW